MKNMLIFDAIIKKLIPIKKLKLNRLSDRKFAEKQMNMVRGGTGTTKPTCVCCCGCLGPSSSADNSAANNAADKWTKGCVVWNEDGTLAT